MKDRKRVFILVLLVLSLALTLYGVLLGLREFEISYNLYASWNIIFAVTIAYWAHADALNKKEYWGFDWPFYAFMFWPIVIPYYLCKTRGFDGLVQFLGVVAIYQGPFLGNLIAYVYYT
jgi:hypothetical protein